ncbi:MAG: tRNA lysidine(34) synthetase TilS [Bacteroides sp.]|nr:tRNA lysidine(34) synthetase TilS [Ruminococcus flavefaciens]MCM1554009.1 tRNA lysidine(34) synthetase TilS [Bacteroides sp.]
MYTRFVEYVEKEQLFAGCKRLLLAVSGGVDSVVLLHLVRRYAAEHGGLELGIAHCNFHLRGEESMRDETFVRALAQEAGIPLFFAEFETESHARQHKISVEMAARELRYAFFEDLLQGETARAFDACLLAHHANDNAETFFINLFRGSGVKGLKGMLPQSPDGRFRRPLLFALRSEIEEYACLNKLGFVEDSTNAQQFCMRNKVRHTLLPAAEACCAGFAVKLNQCMQTLRLTDALVDDWFGRLRAQVVETGCGTQDTEFIAVERLPQTEPHQDLFWELYLRSHAFNRRQIDQIAENRKNGIPGRKFYNADGSGFLLREPEGWRWVGQGDSLQADEPRHEARKVVLGGKDEMDTDPKVAYLDFDKLRFPLVWRNWRAGDRFCPLGMKGFRKLSDFFKDLRLGNSRKEKVWLLCSGQDIVWVAGYRIDNRYKVDFSQAGAKTAWMIRLLEDESR